jgi:hypothetical protein
MSTATVDPAEIERQRSLGWPDFHPEDYCHRCGASNPLWSSPHWHEVMPTDGSILCPNCFLSGEHGRQLWKIMRQAWPGEDEVQPLARLLRRVTDNPDDAERVARCVLDAGWRYRADGRHCTLPP